MLHLDIQIDSSNSAQKACDFLASQSELPKGRIKDAMGKGAVWLTRSNKRKRLRKVTELLKKGDRIELFYDEQLLGRKISKPICLHDADGYSVWFKPDGAVAQGNDQSDHLAMLRIAEQQLSRNTFLVHRLDRETAGLMLIAHRTSVAAQLSQLFSERKVHKRYKALVRGETEASGTIDQSLDGKSAISHFKCLNYDPTADRSLLEVEIETGRTHQIRRHLEHIDHPVIGDPRYGRRNKDDAGLQLFATYLAFPCPLRRQPLEFELSDEFLAKNTRALFCQQG